jgi:hypothetical protein
MDAANGRKNASGDTCAKKDYIILGIRDGKNVKIIREIVKLI